MSLALWQFKKSDNNISNLFAAIFVENSFLSTESWSQKCLFFCDKKSTVLFFFMTCKPAHNLTLYFKLSTVNVATIIFCMVVIFRFIVKIYRLQYSKI